MGGLGLLPEVAWAPVPGRGCSPPGQRGGLGFWREQSPTVVPQWQIAACVEARASRCRSREVFGDGLLFGPLLLKDLQVTRGWTLALGASLFHLVS